MTEEQGLTISLFGASTRQKGTSVTENPLMKMRIDDWIPEFRDIIKAGLEESRVVRLLPRHDVYLWVYDGDGRRFALAFQETWKRLPLGARRRLLSYWASARPA